MANLDIEFLQEALRLPNRGDLRVYLLARLQAAAIADDYQVAIAQSGANLNAARRFQAQLDLADLYKILLSYDHYAAGGNGRARSGVGILSAVNIHGCKRYGEHVVLFRKREVH